MDRQYGENGARSNYPSYNQMRAYVATILSKSIQKIIPFRLFHRAIDKTWIPEKCWPFLYLNFKNTAVGSSSPGL